MKELMRTWPLLMVSAVLFVGAGAWASDRGFEEMAVAMLAGGLICLGVWLAAEVRERHRGEDPSNKGEDPSNKWEDD